MTRRKFVPTLNRVFWGPDPRDVSVLSKHHNCSSRRCICGIILRDTIPLSADHYPAQMVCPDQSRHPSCRCMWIHSPRTADYSGPSGRCAVSCIASSRPCVRPSRVLGCPDQLTGRLLSPVFGTCCRQLVHSAGSCSRTVMELLVGWLQSPSASAVEFTERVDYCTEPRAPTDG